ncbi:hypothetical protein [Escherichia coli]|nr:hypothetical protein [Escherichia coli]
MGNNAVIVATDNGKVKRVKLVDVVPCFPPMGEKPTSATLSA